MPLGSAGFVRQFLALCLVATAPGAARAAIEPYPCPTDPGFCYHDLGGDGCFDAADDDGPIDDTLRRGVWPPEPTDTLGSMVCPPSVAEMTIVAERGFVRWGARDDHALVFFGRRITILGTTNIGFRGGRVRLDAKILAPRDAVVTVGAVGDASINGGADLKGMASRFQATSDEGSIDVGPGTTWRAGHVSFVAFGPDMRGKQVIVDDGVRVVQLGDTLQYANLHIEGVTGVQLENLRARSRGGIRIRSFGGLTAVGRTDLRALRGRVVFHAGSGILQADELTARAATDILISGSEVNLDDRTHLPSRLHVRDRDGGEIRITASVLAGKGLRSETPRLKVTSSVVDLREARIRSRGSALGALELTGANAMCDLTGASLVNVALVHQCQSLEGP
jgi:hypothetical protein